MKYKVKVRRTKAGDGWQATVPGVVEEVVVAQDVDREFAVRDAQAQALRVFADRVRRGEIGPFENALLFMCFAVRDEETK